ncbi:MAG: hypothetical protein Q8O87_03125 [bacterium]|nr:hypothetical protein [bacterium]
MNSGSNERPDDFINKAMILFGKGNMTEPSADEDHGMYERMQAACSGLREYLDRLRRNQGRVCFSTQNAMSDLSKQFINAVKKGDYDAINFTDRAMEMLADGFDDAANNGEIAEVGSRFSRTIRQEQMEALLFGQIWPVIVGNEDAVPELIHWQDFRGNVQAYLYGYIDVATELAKALTEVLSSELTTDGKLMTRQVEIDMYRRYLAIADSIALGLSGFRHIPSYIISNGYGRWLAFSNKLRTVYGCIANIRRDYNLRLSILRIEK